MSRQKLLESLAISHPMLSVTVTAQYEDGHSWDGDGPDPIHESLYPYTVAVTVARIEGGKLIEHTRHLVSCYAEDETHFNDPEHKDDYEIHGYFTQMLEESVSDHTIIHEIPRRDYVKQGRPGLLPSDNFQNGRADAHFNRDKKNLDDWSMTQRTAYLDGYAGRNSYGHWLQLEKDLIGF
tara:strand:+ start:2402 stop:2941 length:540 start_codon:yes stop_codon:yes gene_type:complete